ncbi:amino acid permease [Weissella diestrammenae]|uniref:Amino acid permease n=1 Tax=Weissella diestrammenae TaxID=1162633 RepID=A0A7G9T761_9LACO|nr:amino acid permease [Weissella diestrammenae]MCM0582462.1 amino acid permease [Weissella diestrammenae]QNN75936.1 amino acid permease [Weissella diestrammenae]
MTEKQTDTSEPDQMNRGLTSRHVSMIALGGTIGTGLFLGAGHSIATAGPAIVLIYMIVGMFMFWMMRALGELILSDPNNPTFINYIEKYLGARAGYVMGWTYWIGWITIAMSELTAVGVYMKFWFPNVPSWLFEIGFLLILYGLNVVTVSAFGETEYWFSMIKIIAIVAMIATGIMMAIAHTRTVEGVTSIGNLWQHGLVAHHGHKILAAFQMVFFAFLGIEFVGMTAAETKDPVTTIPKAVNSIIIRILIFYVGALLAIMTIQPWTAYSAAQSPFVQVFSGIGITAAAGIINFVVLTAAASSLNSSIYTTGRMLFSLSSPGQKISKLNQRQLPVNAITVSTLLIALTVVVHFIFPGDAFELITSVASAAFVIMYMMLVYTHIKFRQSTDYLQGEKRFKMPFAPVSNYLTLIFMAGIFIILLSQRQTFWTTVIAIVWYLVMIMISIRKIPK